MWILLKKSLFSRILFDTNEGSLGNAKKRFIREYDLLIREGWMDGEQNGENVDFVYKISARRNKGDITFGEHTGKVTLQGKLPFL